MYNEAFQLLTIVIFVYHDYIFNCVGSSGMVAVVARVHRVTWRGHVSLDPGQGPRGHRVPVLGGGRVVRTVLVKRAAAAVSALQ